MGLGGVAIAVPPYVIHPKTAVLGRAGGQNSLIVLAKDVLMPFCCVLICILVHRLILKILPSKFYKLLGDR